MSTVQPVRSSLECKFRPSPQSGGWGAEQHPAEHGARGAVTLAIRNERLGSDALWAAGGAQDELAVVAVAMVVGEHHADDGHRCGRRVVPVSIPTHSRVQTRARCT